MLHNEIVPLHFSIMQETLPVHHSASLITYSGLTPGHCANVMSALCVSVSGCRPALTTHTQPSSWPGRATLSWRRATWPQHCKVGPSTPSYTLLPPFPHLSLSLSSSLPPHSLPPLSWPLIPHSKAGLSISSCTPHPYTLSSLHPQLFIHPTLSSMFLPFSC